MAFSDTYWHSLIFFLSFCGCLQIRYFTRENVKKKTLELNFVSSVLTEHNSQLVNCKNCVDRCRTIKKKGMLIWGNPRMDCLFQNLASLPRTKRKIRKWTLDNVTILDSGFACSGLFIYNVIWRTDNRRKRHWVNRDYVMESACLRDFHTSWWSIWNRTSERSERVRFLIQNQRVWKSRTKRFPCCNLFILYILRFFLFIQL